MIIRASAVGVVVATEVVDTPDEGAQPGQQFLQGERLGEVIVGAGVKALDAVFGFGAGREDQDRQAQTFGPDHFAHGDSVQHGHAHVEHQCVEATSANHLQGFAAVGGGGDVVTLKGQCPIQRFAHGKIIIGHQHTRPHVTSVPDPGKETVRVRRIGPLSRASAVDVLSGSTGGS